MIFIPEHQLRSHPTVLLPRASCWNTQNKTLLFKHCLFSVIYSPSLRQRKSLSVPESSQEPGIAPGEVPTIFAGIFFLPRKGCRGWGQPGAVGGPAASLENWKRLPKSCHCWEGFDLWWEERKRHLGSGVWGGGRKVRFWSSIGINVRYLPVVIFPQYFTLLKFIFWYSCCFPPVKVIKLLLNGFKPHSSLISHPLPFLTSRNSLQILSREIWNWVSRRFILQLPTPGL